MSLGTAPLQRGNAERVLLILDGLDEIGDGLARYPALEALVVDATGRRHQYWKKNYQN